VIFICLSSVCGALPGRWAGWEVCFLLLFVCFFLHSLRAGKTTTPGTISAPNFHPQRDFEHYPRHALFGMFLALPKTPNP
jgi:hypothetical protein